MKDKLVKYFLKILETTNGFPARNIYSGKLQILMFHRVVSEIGTGRVCNSGIEVTISYLESLLIFYRKHGFKTISIEQVPELIKEKGSQRYVTFTFDDGYEDNLTNALPVFEKYNASFSVYITTDFINRKQFAWWYFLEDLIKSYDEISYRKNDEEEFIRWGSNFSQEAAFAKIRTDIQKNPEILDELIATKKPNLAKYHKLFLDLKQLRLLADSPLVTIGSHTITHPSLSSISDESSWREIDDSKTELEKIIGKTVDHFAYPFGTVNDVSEREIGFVKRAGYKTALTTFYGDARPDSNLFHLPRIWTGMDNTNIQLLKSIYGFNERRKN
jgi:peptidoglycan/xylan/chitin deacetylase (PgdA/CDA1 family)